MTTHAPPPRDELVADASTFELLSLLDQLLESDIEDAEMSELLADLLEIAMLALVDVSGTDTKRSQRGKNPPSKVARRVINRLTEAMEVSLAVPRGKKEQQNGPDG